ncbi:MAG: hypothetical protein Q9213_001793, partial [Squamulea squamosa]
MWNRILGKSGDLDKKASTLESLRKSETQRSTPRRSGSSKSAASSQKTPRNEERDRAFNPTSTNDSSTTHNQHPGATSASIASSYATAFNEPTDQAYLPPGLIRNASLANQSSKPLTEDGSDGVALGSSSKAEENRHDPETMDNRRMRKERRGTRDGDEDRRGTKSSRDKKRKSSEKGKERAMSTDEVSVIPNRRSDGPPITSAGANGSSPFMPSAGQHNGPMPEYTDGRPYAQSSHIQDQFPGQFPTQSATPYRPPLAASEGGPGLAAEYYGDAGQSVVDQPGVRIHSPSLIIGAEPHLQAASSVAAPPPEPSASGGVGAAASFFDGTFSAGSDMEGHPTQKPASTNGASLQQYSSAGPSVSTYSTNGTRPTTQQATSAPVIPTLGAAAAGAAAGYYMDNHSSKPERPEQITLSTSGHGRISSSSSHHQGETHGSYTSSTRPPTKPGKHSSQSSNIPLYAAGAAGVAAAAYHHNHHGTSHHGSMHHSPPSQHHGGSSMAQQHHSRHHGPFSTLIDFFKDPDGVAQFEEYTEYIGVCRHCFDPRSSPRDAPRKHHYRRRRSGERFGSSIRVDKDHRYSSSESENRRRQKNKSWLGAGIAGYGLGKMGESLFLQDNDTSDSHQYGKVKDSQRRKTSSSSERKSRTSYGVVNRSSDTLSRRKRSKDQVENGITSDGKLYRQDSHGNIQFSTAKAHTRRRSRSRSQDTRNSASNIALSAAVGSSVIASHAHRRSKSPKKAFVRSKHGDNKSNSELASTLRLKESDPRDSRHQSHHSPDSKHRHSRRKEKKSRSFFSFSNGSSSSSASSEVAFGAEHGRKSKRGTKTKKRDKETRNAEAALLGLGAAALAFNQTQRPKRKSELIAVKESKSKHRMDNHGHKGNRSSSRSEEDLWESASEREYSSADSELAYGGSLHRRSQESLSSNSSSLDKWSWRWGSKKPKTKVSRDRRHSPTFDSVPSVATTGAIMTGGGQRPPSFQNQDSRMTSSSSIPLQHVYPIPTSDPSQFDVARHESGAPPYQPSMNGRPDPVPIQHPQPVAPVSSAVYASQAPYTHSYSAPVGPPTTSQYPHHSLPAQHQDADITEPRKDLPGAFPTSNEYFESLKRDPRRDPKPRRRDSSPVAHSSEYISSSAGPRRRRSLKDDGSSVRFDLTQEQEDKDRRDERRRLKEEEKRLERLERHGTGERRDPGQDTWAKRDIADTESMATFSRKPNDDSTSIRENPWMAPAAAGVIAAVAAESSRQERSEKDKRPDREERDIEVIVKERPTSNVDSASTKGRGRSSEKTGMSVWQAAAKVKRSSSHTEYAAYFTPTELLSKEPGVKETVGANADNDITVHQVPNMITIQPSEPRGHSPSRAYSFPITAEDMEHSVKPLPWAVPMLNLVEATPPTSRTGSVVGSRSPRARTPLSKEVHDIPLEPLESVMSPDPSIAQPEHVEYTVIEPKERGIGLVDSPVSDANISETVPGISSLKKKHKPRKESLPDANYGDDLDFTATVAAGLQDTGFDPDIVINDRSFRRRDSPPGSEKDEYRRRPTSTVTEITPDSPMPRSPPPGSMEEISEHHIPGSFEEAEEQSKQPRRRNEDPEGTRELYKRTGSSAELTGPSDNADRERNVYSTEIDAFKPKDITNAAVDPVEDRPYGHRQTTKEQDIPEVATDPSDNARVKPFVFTAEPEPLESDDVRNVAIESIPGDQRTATVEEPINGNNHEVDYLSDDTPSIAASAPLPSSSRKDPKTNKKSKRRSVGFDDKTSVTSSPATYGGTQESSSPYKQGRKGGIFGLFSKSTENLPEPRGIQQTPVEASLEDFEEPEGRKKKSKSRKSSRENDETLPTAASSVMATQPEAQDDWDSLRKSKRNKEKRRSSGDPGRITQDLTAQVIPPASPGHDSFFTSDEMLTNLEDQEPGRSLKQSGSDVTFEAVAEPSRIHDNQQPSFLGERPEKPPLPDTPDAPEDPGGQTDLERGAPYEEDLRPVEDRRKSTTAKTEKPNRPVADLQPDGRSVSYSSPSPTAIPLRPLRFGRRPSSPGLAKSSPSTPQPSATADLPLTPRRRERPHSTEFKSNEFRPMWLLEKYGSRQAPTPQETYPSLPSSHSTSRASSVHESDDLYRTAALDLAIDEANYSRLMQAPFGLTIDTGRREDDPELLDSQQATPTAASFQSMVKEEDPDALKAPEHALESQSPKVELLDAIPPASAYIDPLDEPPQEQRLLHGVDDLFPQRRVGSPSRYDAGVEREVSQRSTSRTFSLEPSTRPMEHGLMSTFKDAALGALIGGSAAALLKSTSQHDEHLEQATAQSESEQISKEENDLAPKSADRIPDRPTAEETRLMQEQDAQDAVDSWFSSAQPKRPKLDKKGRKQGKSYEGAQYTSSTDLGRQLEGAGEQSSPILEGTAMTAEPTEVTLTTQSDAFKNEPSAAPADLNYQAALTSRRDSKGKKKKNKKKTLDAWEESPAGSTEVVREPQPSTEIPVGQNSIFKDIDIADALAAESMTTSEPSTLLAEADIIRDAEALPTNTEAETSFALTKKNKKGKKKNRSRSLADPVTDQPHEESQARNDASLSGSPEQSGLPTATGILESASSVPIIEEVPYEFPSYEGPDTKLPLDSFRVAEINLAKDEPEQSVSEDVPYPFSSLEREKVEKPDDLPNATNLYLTRATDTVSDPSVAAVDTSFDKSMEEPILEATPFLNAKSTAIEDSALSSKLAPPDLDSLLPPEGIPLPLDDDSDLLEALPKSPVLQPLDTLSTNNDDFIQTQDLSGSQPMVSDNTHDQPVEALDDEPTVLNRAISELALPESAAATEETVDDETTNDFAFATDKKSKNENKSKKSKGPRAPAFEIDRPAEETLPTENTLASGRPEDVAIAFSSPAMDLAQAPLLARADETDISTKDVEIPSEPPVDDGPDSTTNKGKKGNKDREGRSIELETEQTNLSSTVPETKPTSSQEVEGIPAREEFSVASLLPADILLEGQQGVDSIKPAAGTSKFSEPVKEELSTPAAEDNEDWLTSKEKKKGKKSKRVQFDEHGGSRNEEPEAAAVAKVPVAGTNTASEVQDLLRGPVSEDSGETSKDKLPESGEPIAIAPVEETHVRPIEQPSIVSVGSVENGLAQSDETQVPKKPLPVLFTQRTASGSINMQQFGLDERTLAGGTDFGRSAKIEAATDTAAEIQAILSEAEKPDGFLPTGEDANIDKATEADDFAWAPQKKKKGRMSKLSEDTPFADIQMPDDQSLQEPFDSATSTSEDVAQHGPAEDVSVEKPNKDKKNKRQSLSRLASDLGEESLPQNTSSAVEEPQNEAEMRITDNAPSILEKTDQLRSIATPIWIDPEQQIPSSPSSVHLETSMAAEEPNTSESTRGADVGPTYDVQPPPTAVDVPSQVLKVEQMATSANEPSILEKQDELPSIEQPFSPEAGQFLIDRDVTGLIAATDLSLDPCDPLSQDPEDSKPTMESIPAATEPTDVSNRAEALSNQLLNEGSEQVPEVEDTTVDETLQPIQEPSFAEFAKSKKEKKSSKKAKASPWENETSTIVPDSLTRETKKQEKTFELQDDQPVQDDLPDDQSVATKTHPQSKKDKKKGKKAKASAWDDNIPEAAAEIPETEQLVKGDVEAITVDTEQLPMLKKDKKKTKKVKASLWDFDTPEASTGAFEPPSEVNQVGLEQTAVGNIPASFEEPLKSKRDKKKSKKPRADTWEEEDQSVEPAVGPTEFVVASEDSELAKELSTEPVAEIAVEQPTSKKEKKRGKKSKFVAWDDDGPTSLAEDDSKEQAVPSGEAEILDTQPEAVAEKPIEGDIPDGSDRVLSKKSKKEGKQSKFVAFDEEPSVPAADDDDVQLEPKSLENEVQPKASTDMQEPVLEKESALLDKPSSSKKEKKRGKKSKLVDFDKEPSIPPSRDEEDQQNPISTDLEMVAERPIDRQVPMLAEGAIGVPDELPRSKKGKKKGKKSKFVDSDEEPSAPSSRDETGQQEPIFTESEPAIEQRGEAQKSTDEQETLTPLDDLSPGKEGKKRWDEEPSGLSIEEEPEPERSSKVPEADLLPSIPRTIDVGVVQNHEMVETAVLKSKKDKKRAKKAVAFSWNEEPSPAIAEPTIPDTDDLPPDFDDSASKLQMEMLEDSRVPGSAAENERQADTATKQTGELQISSAILPEGVDDVEIKRDTPHESTEGTKDGEHSISAFATETIQESSHQHPERPLSPSSADAVAAGTEALRNLADENPDIEATFNLGHEDHTVEDIKKMSTDQPLQQALPLLLPTDDVHIGSTLAPSAGDALKVAEASIPLTPPGGTLKEHPSPTETPANELVVPPLAYAALDDAKSINEQASVPPKELLDHGPDISTDTMNEAGESGPLPEGGPLDVMEHLASTQDKITKPNKSEEIMVWEDDATAPIQNQDPTISEGTREIGISANEAAVLPGISSEQAPEDTFFMSRKDNKNPKKEENTFSLDDEPSGNTTSIELEAQVDKENRTDVEPSLPIEPVVAEALGDLQPVSKKSKKKGKIKQTFDLDDEPSQSTTPVEPEFGVGVTNQIAEEPSLPTETVTADDFGPASMGNKKSKNKKKALSFYEEPTGDALPAAPILAEPSADQVGQQTPEETVPGPTGEPIVTTQPNFATAEDDSPRLSKRDKKKSKKNKKAFGFDDEPSESTTPAEPIFDDKLASRSEEPYLPPQGSIAAAEDEFPELSKKDKEMSEKNKAPDLGDEHSEIITPAELDLKAVAPDVPIDGRPLPTEASITEAPEEFSAPSKKNKKSEKNKKSFSFDDGPSESITPAEPVPFEQDIPANGQPVLAEPSLAEALEDLSTPSKKAKKSKKSKKAFAFEDEPILSTTPADIVDAPAEELALPAEPSAAEVVDDEFGSLSKKDRKKAKKGKKGFTFDEPSESTASLGVPDQPAEESFLPTNPSASEVVHEFESLSKKDRKKAKKGMKGLTFDEKPSESTTPAEIAVASELAEPSIAEIPEDFASLSKKDKNGKKAMNTVTSEDMSPGAAPKVEEAALLVTQLQEQDSALHSMPQPELSKAAEPLRAQYSSPVYSNGIDSNPPEQPKEGASPMATTPDVVNSNEGAGQDGAIAPQVSEPELSVTSKQSKKDKKKAKKAQAFTWGNDEPTAEFPMPEIVSVKDRVVPLPEIQEGRIFEDVAKRTDIIDTQTPLEESQQITPINLSLQAQFGEPELAPRHQDPTSLKPIDTAVLLEEPRSPTLVKAPEEPRDADNELTAKDPIIESTGLITSDPTGVTSKPTLQASSPNNDEDFAPFAPTKKSKKSKKGKKQAIDWEDDTVPPPDPAPEMGKTTKNDTTIASRPETVAWPTEVKLNQSTAAVVPEEQQSSVIDVVDDLTSAMDYSLPDEPEEPAPVEDNRSDYFGNLESQDLPSEPQPLEEDTYPVLSTPALDVSVEDTQTEAESSAAYDSNPAVASQETVNEPIAVAEQSRNLEVAAGPVEDYEGFAITKKEKKSKRKKKQALEDTMWEFPPIPPPTVEEMAPIESKWPSDPSRGDRLYKEPPAPPTKDEQSLDIPGEDVASSVPITEPPMIPIGTQDQVDVQGEPRVAVEPRLEEAADDDWGAISKKARKGKKSKKGKVTDDFEEAKVDAQRAAQNLEEAGGDVQTDKRRLSPAAGPIGAMGTAGAVGAGLAVAQGLGPKDSKDKKKKKGRQASSTWPEPNEDYTRGIEAAVDDGSNAQSKDPTPERRSPIQAWHQNISPTQSPARSELYEVEDDRPRSTGSYRRKRSYGEERRQSIASEGRSPINAWHQYDTSRSSPQQSELYDYNRVPTRSPKEQFSGTAVNRDSAVHVGDSPLVSQHSPVRRAMRDSGYPDTEASPVVGQGVEHQEDQGHLQGRTRDIGQDDHEAFGENPLHILPEGIHEGRHQNEQTRSRSPSRRLNNDKDLDLDLPPRHPRPASFDEVRKPSPISSTSKERSSVLFESSPSTREEQAQREEQRQAQIQGSPTPHERRLGAERLLTPQREDNSEMVNARAESLAALSGMRGPSQEQRRSYLFGGPVGIISDETAPETPIDDDGVNRRRLNAITEYSPEESPLHKKNRDVSDVGVSAHGVKVARRSGTPQAIISKQQARSPLTESEMATVPTEEARSFWPSIDEEKQSNNLERSRSRGTEQRPSSHQSNISSLVSGPPKQREYERRSFSGASNHSIESINAIIRTPPDQIRSASGMSNRSSGTPPLRRTDRSVSSDLRGANRKSEANKRAKQPEAEIDTSISIPVPSTTPNDSTKDKTKSKGRVKQMADVFVSHHSSLMTTLRHLTDMLSMQEGYGDSHGSPLSPTRPPSVRRRQSMQVLELESRNDRLSAENRQLHEAKLRAERDLEDAAHDRSQEVDSYREGIETREAWLRQKDTELSQLKETIENLQGQVTQLNEINQGLHASSRRLEDHQEKYIQLESEHASIHQQWQQSIRELEDLRQQHAQLSAGMESIVRHEVTTALESKNLELHRLQSDLTSAQSQIRTLQAQILASNAKNASSSDSLLSRDEDYFDTLCQSLCSHVQQWVLRFSKFSDSRACYLASEIRDEKIVDRMENAILDGSDVDTYLADRVKRRDVFMSMVMTMIWEYIFTRYLFGADREQRQKLKSLEKTLSESPQNSKQSIHKWRATTLHLLSKREAFRQQREKDTEAVMHTIYQCLATILPPPSHLIPQIQTSLMKVLSLAVDLSIEMRTQRFEYVMLPPLQPEYDTNGDLARKVYFNAALMNERGNGAVSNEELENMKAV